MGTSTQTTVGCAVGIPIGVGIIVALLFWFNLHLRVKREDREDLQLQEEINAELDFDNYENLYDGGRMMKNDNNQDYLDDSTDPSTSRETSQANQEKRQVSSSGYIPAYRRKINTFIESNEVMNNNNQMDTSNGLSDSSLQNQSNKGANLKTYDLMVPMFPGTISYNNTDTESNITDVDKKNSVQVTYTDLRKNLFTQDFGSYPRRASATDVGLSNNPFIKPNISNSSFHTRSSSLNTDNNNYNSNNRRDYYETNFENPSRENFIKNYSSDNRRSKIDFVNSNMFEDDNDTVDELSETDDPYDNEYTNYYENRRTFINSLKP